MELPQRPGESLKNRWEVEPKARDGLTSPCAANNFGSNAMD
jgi:hypothetical protein